MCVFHDAISQETSAKSVDIPPHITVSSPENIFLFANYDNVIDINGLNGMSELDYVLENISVQPDPEAPHFFIARTTDGANQAKIRFYKKSDHSLVNEVVFNVLPLPMPQIFWTITAKSIRIGYPADMVLNSAKVRFTVRSWKISVSGAPEKEVSGNGSNLSSQAINLVQNAPKNSEIKIIAVFSGGGYESKEISGTFTK